MAVVAIYISFSNKCTSDYYSAGYHLGARGNTETISLRKKWLEISLRKNRVIISLRKK